MEGQWDARSVIVFNYKHIVKYLSFEDIMALVRALFLYEYPCTYGSLELCTMNETNFFLNYHKHFCYLNVFIRNVRFLKPCLPLYEHLRVLRFRNCSMYGELPIKEFSNLAVLELSHCSIMCISTEFVENVWNLLVLNLSHNTIGRIEGLHLLKKLKHLEIVNNRINHIENLDELIYLLKINHANHSDRKIKNWLPLPALEYLNLKNDNEYTIEYMNYLPKLSYLCMNDNKLTVTRELKLKRKYYVQ